MESHRHRSESSRPARVSAAMKLTPRTFARSRKWKDSTSLGDVALSDLKGHSRDVLPRAVRFGDAHCGFARIFSRSPSRATRSTSNFTSPANRPAGSRLPGAGWLTRRFSNRSAGPAVTGSTIRERSAALPSGWDSSALPWSFGACRISGSSSRMMCDFSASSRECAGQPRRLNEHLIDSGGSYRSNAAAIIALS